MDGMVIVLPLKPSCRTSCVSTFRERAQRLSCVVCVPPSGVRLEAT